MTDENHPELDEYGKFEAAELAAKRAKGNNKLGAVLGVLIFGVLIFLFITKYSQEALAPDVAPLAAMAEKAAKLGAERSAKDLEIAVLEAERAAKAAELELVNKALGCVTHHTERLIRGDVDDVANCDPSDFAEEVTPEVAESAPVFTQAQ